jgi:hypothetical protein
MPAIARTSSSGSIGFRTKPTKPVNARALAGVVASLAQR